MLIPAFAAFSAPDDPVCVAYARQLAADLEAAHISGKVGAACAGCDDGRWSRAVSSGLMPVAFLLKLPHSFWAIHLPALAARVGFGVVSADDAHLTEAVKHHRAVIGVRESLHAARQEQAS